MQTEQKKVTAKDLSLFVGLPCAIYGGGDPVSHYIEGVDIDTNKVIAERVNYNPEQIKPIFRKLEDITIEESVHISCDIMGYDSSTDDMHRQWNQNDKMDITEFGMIQFDTKDSIFLPKVMKYLIERGFNLHLIPEGTYLEVDEKGYIDLKIY